MAIPLAARGASHLECSRCGATQPSERLTGLSGCCAAPLFVRYDLDRIRPHFRPGGLRGRRADIWRYEEVLPLRDSRLRANLGEGYSPLVDAPRLAQRLGVRRVWIKDEGGNPTGSFKARGLAVAMARAAELGARDVALPSTGNAASAAAAYGAALGLRVHLVVPRNAPPVTLAQIRELGADLQLIDGVLTDCGRIVRDGVRAHGWFDLSTFKEPYRVEGKKTMGYELFEQLGCRLPDVIVYPTGGGTGLVALWKAFAEMERLGWLGSERPRMFSVQAEGCAPIVRAWEEGATEARPWDRVETYASGLRAPATIADSLILRALRESRGGAVAVCDADMARMVRCIGADTGVFACPEGGATAAATRILVERSTISADAEVVLFNTASGLKYVGVAGPLSA